MRVFRIKYGAIIGITKIEKCGSTKILSMGKRKPKLRVVSGNLQELGLPEKEAVHLHSMLAAWQARRLGLQRHAQNSVGRDIAVIHDFIRHSAKPPWEWSEEDFERWCAELGLIRKLKPSTQRHYQNVIKLFLQYLIENIRFRAEIDRNYGIAIRQICHKENCIPHIVERELSIERRAMTHAEIDRFFSQLDKAIAESHRFSGKDYRPLQRDKVLFFTIYTGGLRISEARGLDIHSFRENAEIPEFGSYGIISVWGKGSRGSGPRHRLIPVDHQALPPLLDWYVKHVRPYFASRADPNEDALFISERGNRMSISTMESRFQHALNFADLTGMNLTPHSLRHSSVTHESMRLSSEAVRRKHGHTYQSTTQAYTHIPDEFVRDEMTRVTRNLIDTAEPNESGNDST